MVVDECFLFVGLSFGGILVEFCSVDGFGVGLGMIMILVWLEFCCFGDIVIW